MKLTNYVAGVGIALIVGATAPIAWGQVTEPNVINGTTTIAPAATLPTVPAEKAAPGAPGSSTDPGDPDIAGARTAANYPAAQNAPGVSDKDMINAEYVHNKISQAQTEGRDVSAARMQEAMGDSALKNGMNDEAAQHFATALQAIGAMPAGPDESR
jgi:hypothetical protein